LLDRRAAILVTIAIGFGGILQLVALALSHVKSIEPDTLIRYDIVLTLGLYAAVAALIVSQVTPSIRLRWGDGPLAVRVGIGAGVGIGFSLLLLAIVSGAAGHLQPDPRIVLLMSAGDPTHIIITAFISCVAAPLVEETLFRGLLLESLRPRGAQMAVLLSAVAFAAWHFMPAALVYYAALGAALGGLYLKRGLACSIAAHAGFNGVLTIAAIMVVLGPSHVIQVGGLDMTAPSGWSVHTPQQPEFSNSETVLIGPSDAQLAVVSEPNVSGATADSIAARLRSGVLAVPAELQVDPASVREVMEPVGELVEESASIEGHDGTLAMLAVGGQAYQFVFIGAGSAKAQQGFDQMLKSLH
jgi:membrane protease YdiL (CAAX protease family)